MNKELLNLLRTQAEIEFNAHSLGLALSLWAKSYGWAGTHKWLGRFSVAERKHVKGILKFIADYAGEKVSLPAAVECSCEATNLPDVYGQVLGAVRASQSGWMAISAAAAKEGERAVEEFCDDYLDDNIDMIKRLTRFGRLLEAAKGDIAAAFAFDKERA